MSPRGNWLYGLQDSMVCKLGKVARHGRGGKTKIQWLKSKDGRTGPKFFNSYADWKLWKRFDVKVFPLHKNTINRLFASILRETIPDQLSDTIDTHITQEILARGDKLPLWLLEATV